MPLEEKPVCGRRKGRGGSPGARSQEFGHKNNNHRPSAWCGAGPVGARARRPRMGAGISHSEYGALELGDARLEAPPPQLAAQNVPSRRPLRDGGGGEGGEGGAWESWEAVKPIV
jgi:hypothetical protein